MFYDDKNNVTTVIHNSWKYTTKTTMSVFLFVLEGLQTQQETHLLNISNTLRSSLVYYSAHVSFHGKGTPLLMITFAAHRV